jgi:hypothetical protein
MLTTHLVLRLRMRGVMPSTIQSLMSWGFNEAQRQLYVRRGTYRALAGKPEGRRPIGRPRRRWEDNIKMDLREIGWGHGLDQSGSG